ncbi:hypothetical protein [Pseudoxanthomonas winnipegensis]|uniref:Uncharacterized protein n=1 Tax=Pseudoxanthomonas winnipegensis TaxID=2480810 RepID=A0A4Q8M479_9GAMM|nr:hypothetical protein [Pseudoxanthomonas winnipegensis]TAA41560.1 hypothetical protein EA655_11500 [Pseudoxanthomonas winnipegensis]
MWYAEAKKQCERNRQQIFAYNFDAFPNFDALMKNEDYVANLEELAGLNFRLRLFESKNPHDQYVFDVVSGDYSDTDLGNQIITGTGIASPEYRKTLSKHMNDMLDMSIPLENPQMCMLLLERVRLRYGYDDKAKFQQYDQTGIPRDVKVYAIHKTALTDIRDDPDCAYEQSLKTLVIHDTTRELPLSQAFKDMGRDTTPRKELTYQY